MITIKDCDREASGRIFRALNVGDFKQAARDAAEHRELGAREGVAEVVAYLRSQAAIALVHDLPLMEGADKKRLDLIIVALEKYADAIERGEHRNP